MGDFDKKGPLYATGAAFHQLFNAAGLCSLYMIGSTTPVAELISSVTGWDFDWEEGLRVGRRILTLKQAFNVREGLSPADFQLPKRIREMPISTGKTSIAKIDFEELRKGYFNEMGWDTETGQPYPDTMSELGLDI